jgi:hypothetical protein
MRFYELFEDAVAYNTYAVIKKTITTQIKDPSAQITGAIDLVARCYQASSATVPKDMKDPGYAQYSDLLIYTVKQLQKATDAGIRDNSWKITDDKSPYV